MCFLAISDKEDGWKSTYLITILLPVSVILVTIAIIITLVIMLQKKRKQRENRTHALPDHIYDVPDDTRRSQLRYQKENNAVVEDNTTLHLTLSPYDMKSNVAYGFIVSDQQA